MTYTTNRTGSGRKTGWKGTRLVHWLKGHDLWAWDYPGTPQRTECSCGKVWPR
jgi:hypothetical protein